MHREALEQLALDPKNETSPVIVVASRNWHAGVVGIVASRLMRHFYKPCFVISVDDEGVGKGSGRSVEGVSLVEAIRAGRQHLLAGGGHHMAAGLSIEEGEIGAFRECFSQYVHECCNQENLRPRVMIDGEVHLGDLSLDFLSRYELLQPFGNSNPQPIFMSRKVWLTDAPYRMKNNHLKFTLRQDGAEQEAVFFGGGAQPLPEPPWDVAYTIDRNEFRGRVRLQLSIQRVRSAR